MIKIRARAAPFLLLAFLTSCSSTPSCDDPVALKWLANQGYENAPIITVSVDDKAANVLCHAGDTDYPGAGITYRLFRSTDGRVLLHQIY